MNALPAALSKVFQRLSHTALTAAAVLFTLASATWFIHAALLHAPREALRELRSDDDASVARLSALADDLAAAPGLMLGATRVHAQAALGFERLAKQGQSERPDVERVRRQQAEALRRAPVRPYAWARLAYLDLLLGGPPEQMIDSLRLSIYTGPNQRQLALLRLELAARAPASWDAGFRASLVRQPAPAWAVRPSQLARLAASDAILALTRDALLRDPEALRRFDALVDRRAGLGQ